MFKRFFLNLKGLSDAFVASLIKKGYGFAVHFLKTVLILMSDDWFRPMCWSSLLFRIFIIKKSVVFSLTFFGTLKYECVIKTREMFYSCFY